MTDVYLRILFVSEPYMPDHVIGSLLHGSLFTGIGTLLCCNGQHLKSLW
jgi:hypothetical protein